MARAIVRYSINGEASNITGNQARGALGEGGIERIGTASYEGEGSTEALMGSLRRLLEILENPPGEGSVDHLWIYFDHPPEAN